MASALESEMPELAEHAAAGRLALALVLIVTVAGCAAAAPTGSAPTSSVAPVPQASIDASPPKPRKSPASTTAFVTLPAENITTHAVLAVSAGWDVCAIRTDATLACWGGSSEAPPSGTFTAIDNGEGSACAIRTDGTLACWGDIGSKAPAGRYTKVSTAEGRACAIRTDGTLACWSTDWDDNGNPTYVGSRPADLPTGSFATVSLGPEYSCAIRTDGTLACWGSVATDASGNPIEVVPPPGTYSSISLPCTIRIDGALQCWLLAPGGLRAVVEPAGTFTAVSTAGDLGCAIRTDGTLACWGSEGSDDQGNDVQARTPAGTFTAISIGSEGACGLRSDGKAVCWGQDDQSVRPLPTAAIQIRGSFVSTTRVPLRWIARPLFAGAASYDVRYTQSRWDQGPGSSAWADGSNERPIEWRSATTATEDVFTGRPGYTYCFSVRAHDADALTSDWAFGPCRSIPLDDRSLARSAGWKSLTGQDFFESTAVRSSSRGAKLTLAGVNAGSIGIIATTCPTCGRIEVSYLRMSDADDEGSRIVETVSLRAPRTANRQLVWTSEFDEESWVSGRVTIKVVSSGKPVTIDGIVLPTGWMSP